MEKIEGETRGSVGQGCPALQKLQGNKNKSSDTGQELHTVQASPWELQAIEQLLSMAGCGPHGPSGKSAGQLCRLAGWRLVGVLFMFATIGGGAACGLGHHFSPVAHQTGHNTAVPVHATARDPQTGRRRANPDGETDEGHGSRDDAENAQTLKVLPDGQFEAWLEAQGAEQVVLSPDLLQVCRVRRDLLNDLIRGQESKVGSSQLADGSKQMPEGGKHRSTDKFCHTIGNFHYLTGFGDVWLGSRHIDLHEHKKARLCLEFMVDQNALDEASALHFLNEIDPHVRNVGDYLPSVDSKIDYYFRGHDDLLYLRQNLIGSSGRNGKYYLRTDAG